MIKQNEVEEIISLIHKGFNLELLSFELDVSIQELQTFEEQLKLRRFVKESINTQRMNIAIQKLNTFIQNTENNIVERMMLAKLKAYINKTNISEEDLIDIEEEQKRIGFSKNIDQILEELGVQIPKRKSSNIKRKEKQLVNKSAKQNDEENLKGQEETIKLDYEQIIRKYKQEIATNPNNILSKRNLLAFAYYRAGSIDEARAELECLIDQYGHYTAYRQLIYIEKCEGNLDDAKLWAYDGLEKFPDSVAIRQQLITIAKEEKDNEEIIRQLKQIIKINPLHGEELHSMLVDWKLEIELSYMEEFKVDSILRDIHLIPKWENTEKYMKFQL